MYCRLQAQRSMTDCEIFCIFCDLIHTFARTGRITKAQKTQKSYKNAQTFQLEQLIDQLFTIREKSFACENYLIRTVYTPVTNAICAWNRRCSVRCPYGALSTRTETVSSSYGLRAGTVRVVHDKFPAGAVRCLEIQYGARDKFRNHS